MRINHDLTTPVLLDTDSLPWVPSPAKGVDRRMLERDGEEVARATSLVRYAPGCRFDSHVHTLGEEFIVLEGIFADEHGSYPPGTYVRNPPESAHAPFSETGCVIFVKLRQMAPSDRVQVCVAINTDPRLPQQVLHTDERERVHVRRLKKGETWEGDGAEVLVLSGQLTDADGRLLGPRTWARRPGVLRTTEDAQVWIKDGHLS